MPTDRTHHIVRIPVRQRRDPETNIAENLHMNTAQPKADERAKYRILRYPYEHFCPFTNHWLNQHSFECIRVSLSIEPISNGAECLPGLSGVANIQMDAADLCFVHQSSRHELDGDGKPQGVSQLNNLSLGVRHAAGGNR